LAFALVLFFTTGTRENPLLKTRPKKPLIFFPPFCATASVGCADVIHSHILLASDAGAALYKFLEPGIYPYVTHNMIEAVELGGTAHFKVEGPWNDDLMTQVKGTGGGPCGGALARGSRLPCHGRRSLKVRRELFRRAQLRSWRRPP
jgi:hypothetical protein